MPTITNDDTRLPFALIHSSQRYSVKKIEMTARPVLTSAPSENGPGQQTPPVCLVQDHEVGVLNPAIAGMDGTVIDERYGDAKRISEQDNNADEDSEDDHPQPATESTGLLSGRGSLRRRKVRKLDDNRADEDD